MARPVMLGNGQLTVGLNEHGLVHDFYYPYVGLDNLTTARSVHHKIGVWVDGQFSWVGDEPWQVNVDFENDALVSSITLNHPELQVQLQLQDFVDYQVNAFVRHIVIVNMSDREREIRVFMHQVFQISRAGRADTALFVPDGNYLLDYKGHCSLLIYGQSDGKVFDQFSAGNYGIEGKEGTFKDAEDGELSNNPVEHSGVDTVLRFSNTIPAGESKVADYWIVAADSQEDAEVIHAKLLHDSIEVRLAKTRVHWQDWLATANARLKHINNDTWRIKTQKSLLIIKAHIDRRGGVIASCDSSIYNFGRDYYSYVWPRDGCYAIWPLIRLGYTDEAKQFFVFCRDILSPEGYLKHKYQPDRAIGSTWHPLLRDNHKELAIQEDETAIVLYMLGEYHEATKDDEFVRNLYSTLVQPAANFMASFIDEATGLPHASYDLWEERFLTTTYSTACTYQALLVAADFADKFGYPDDAIKWQDAAQAIQKNSIAFFDEDRQAYRKGFLLKPDGSLQLDNTIDMSSLYGVMMFAGSDFGIENTAKAMQTVEQTLLDRSPSGGAPRYEYDHYFESDPPHLGNPWFVTTLWAAQYYVRTKHLDKAKHYLQWTTDKMLPSGVLSEQVHPVTGQQVSVAPLVWSHAEYINTVLDIAQADPDI